MNEYDSEVAHSGNGINTSKTAALRPIWQFAIDRAMIDHGGRMWLESGSAGACFAFCLRRTGRLVTLFAYDAPDGRSCQQ